MQNKQSVKPGQTIPPGGIKFGAEVIVSGHETTVYVSGEVDVAAADTFRDVLQAAVLTSDRIVLDLAGTTFIDSTGLAVIMNARKNLGDTRGAVTIRSATGGVRSVLRVTGFERLVIIED